MFKLDYIGGNGKEKIIKIGVLHDPILVAFLGALVLLFSGQNTAHICLNCAFDRATMFFVVTALNGF